MATKKCRTTNFFSPFSFVFAVGSRDLRSEIRDKHPRSAPLEICVSFLRVPVLLMLLFVTTDYLLITPLSPQGVAHQLQGECAVRARERCAGPCRLPPTDLRLKTTGTSFDVDTSPIPCYFFSSIVHPAPDPAPALKLCQVKIWWNMLNCFPRLLKLL